MPQKKIIDLLRKVAKKTNSKTAKDLVKDEEYGMARAVAHNLFDEALENFCKGDMTWDETVDDLRENLKALEMPKPDDDDDANEEDD